MLKIYCYIVQATNVNKEDQVGTHESCYALHLLFRQVNNSDEPPHSYKVTHLQPRYKVAAELKTK